MKTSKPHHLFVDYLGNQRALSNPDEFLGPNWKDVLNFWLYLDTLSYEQLDIVDSQYRAFDLADKDSVWFLARNAASEVTSRHISNCVYVSTPGHVRATATIELMGAHKILGQGDTLTCVPMFLNL
jgi:hypothetical protein